MRNFINIVENANHVPPEIVSKYTTGDCMYLALAMSEKYGWKIIIMVQETWGDDGEEGEWITHAFCSTEKGYVDIEGIHPELPDYDYDDLREWTSQDFRPFLKGLTDGDFANEITKASEVTERYIAPLLSSEP